MTKLNDAIKKLKILSNGSINNTSLPDDDLLDEYEREINLKFSDDYRQVLKSINNVFYGRIDLLSVTQEKKYPSELSVVLKEAHQQGVPQDQGRIKL